MISKDEMRQHILSQGIKISSFLKTEEWQIIKNRLAALKKTYHDKRVKSMNLQSTRENCLYWTGTEDALDMVIDEIYRIVSDAEKVRVQIENEKEVEEDAT